MRGVELVDHGTCNPFNRFPWSSAAPPLLDRGLQILLVVVRSAESESDRQEAGLGRTTAVRVGSNSGSLLPGEPERGSFR